MLIGDILKSTLGGRSQKIIASDWLSEWHKQPNSDVLSESTAPSKLNKLLNNDPEGEGLKFFFAEENAARGRLLLEILLPGKKPEQENIFQQAKEQLRFGGRPAPKLVIDLSGFSYLSLELVKAILDKLGREIKPTVLLVTEAQLDAIPRSISEKYDSYSFWEERVIDHRTGQQRISDLLQDGCLVATTRQLNDYAHWISLAVTGDSVELEPVDWAEQFTKQKQLASLPEVLHLLEEIEVQEKREPLPEKLTERRRLAYALCSEQGAERLDKSPELRLGYANQLGIKATSTAKERKAFQEKKSREKTEAEILQIESLLGKNWRQAHSIKTGMNGSDRTNLNHSVPVGLYLSGCGLAADITFGASPLLLDSGLFASVGGVTAASITASELADEEQRLLDDDY
jgi:hypothetical protein